MDLFQILRIYTVIIYYLCFLKEIGFITLEKSVQNQQNRLYLYLATSNQFR